MGGVTWDGADVRRRPTRLALAVMGDAKETAGVVGWDAARLPVPRPRSTQRRRPTGVAGLVPDRPDVGPFRRGASPRNSV